MNKNGNPHVMLDSGAYSAFTRGGEIDLQQWIDFCLWVTSKNPDIEYVNLDIIGQPGVDTGEASFENWMKMREAGLTPLPVYHVFSSAKWLKKYLEHTDYVGIGAIADMNTQRRIESLDRVWEDHLVDRVTRLPKCRTHGMGLTSFPLMSRYPWFSVDSTSWLQAGMYGKVFVPRTTNGKWDYTRKPYHMDVSAQSPRKKVKQRHMSNLTPHNLKSVMAYIKDAGFTMGVSKMEDGVEVKVEPGLSNDYNLRCYMNAVYYSRFISALPYPRPFKGSKAHGLFETSVAPTHKVGESGTGCTRLYFSGEIILENYMRENPKEFKNSGIMLTYYMLRQSKANRSARRLRGLIKNRPCKMAVQRAAKVPAKAKTPAL